MGGAFQSQVTFDQDESDVFAQSAHRARRRWWVTALIVVFGLLGSLPFLLLARLGTVHEGSSIPVTFMYGLFTYMLVFSVGLGLYLAVWFPRIVAARLLRDPEYRLHHIGQRTLTVSPEGLGVQTLAGGTLFPWDLVSRVSKTPSAIYFDLPASDSAMCPLRAFPDAECFDACFSAAADFAAAARASSA